MIFRGILIFVTIWAACAISDTKLQVPALPLGALNGQDIKHFYDILDSYDKTNLKELHYAVLGNSAFGRDTPDACSVLASVTNWDGLEAAYYVTAIASRLKNCPVKSEKVQEVVNKFKDQKLTGDEVFYLISIANVGGAKLDKAAMLKVLTNLIDRDGSPSGLSAILASAAALKGVTKKDLEPFTSLVGKLVEQADETDGKLLYFERGAYTTAFAVESIFNFAAASGVAPGITEQQLIKFGNSLYSRRHAHQIRTSARIASALKVLSTNAFMVPVVVYNGAKTERAGASGLLVDESRVLHLRLVNILGDEAPFSADKFVLESGVMNSADKNVVGSSSARGAFKQSKEGIFSLELTTKEAPISQGRYTIQVQLKPKQAKAGVVYAGVTNAEIPLRIVSQVNVEKAVFKVSSQEKSQSGFEKALTMPNKLPIPADAAGVKPDTLKLALQSHLRFSFSLTDSISGAPVQPHQVFVQLTHHKTLQAVTYLCKQSTAAGSYSYNLFPDGAAADFDGLSGVYRMELILGDALLAKPVTWHLTDVELKFPMAVDSIDQSEDVARQTVASVAGRKRASHPRIGEGPSRSAKPELHHTFRKPDPRPSDLLALTFTGLCCAPFGVVLLAWLIMGANLRNFPCSLSAPLFHLGLGGIFALYLMYWFHLNMFETLRYLLFIGVATFFFGNRLLRHMGEKRKEAEGAADN